MKTFSEGWVVRCPTMGEISAVLALLHAKERANSREGRTTEESLQEVWQTPGFNLSTDVWVVTTQDEQIIGLRTSIRRALQHNAQSKIATSTYP